MLFPTPKNPPDLIEKFNDYKKVSLAWYKQGDCSWVRNTTLYVPLRHCAGLGRDADKEAFRKYIYRHLKSKDNNLNHFYVMVQSSRFDHPWYVLDLRTGECITNFSTKKILVLDDGEV